MSYAGLTAEEQATLDSLKNAWDNFVALERVHPDEVKEFKGKLHDLQRLVLVRPVLRQNGKLP